MCPEFDPPQNYVDVERAAAVLVVPQFEPQMKSLLLQLGPQLGPYEPQQLWQIGQLSELMQIEPSQLPSAAASCENSA